MTYTLTKIKTFLGREGRGLNATICLAGKPVAFVFDDASGGGVDIDFSNPLQTAASYNASKATHAQAEQDCLDWASSWYDSAAGDACRAALLKFNAANKCNLAFDTRRARLEQWIDHEVNAQELAKSQAAQLKRWAKTQTVFRLVGDEPGTYRTLKCPTSDQRGSAMIIRKYGDTVEMIYPHNQVALRALLDIAQHTTVA